MDQIINPAHKAGPYFHTMLCIDGEWRTMGNEVIAREHIDNAITHQTLWEIVTTEQKNLEVQFCPYCDVNYRTKDRVAQHIKDEHTTVMYNRDDIWEMYKEHDFAAMQDDEVMRDILILRGMPRNYAEEVLNMYPMELSMTEWEERHKRTKEFKGTTPEIDVE
jgi:hypothetical protein